METNPKQMEADLATKSKAPVPAPSTSIAPPVSTAEAPPASSLAASMSAIPDGVPKKPEVPEKKAAAADAPRKAESMTTDTKVVHVTPTPLHNIVIFSLAIIGLVAALIAAYIFGMARKAQPPVFKPVSSPFDNAIYANGIIESDQPSGANINIYPEVTGPVTQVLVREGQQVLVGTPLFAIEDSVQRANTAQLRLQFEAALAVLDELNALPRPETLAIVRAQVGQAEANEKTAQDQYAKRRASYEIDPKSISKDVLDAAEDAVHQASAAWDVARTQYELTKAGAWSYDIVNQEKLCTALKQAYTAANAQLHKYSVQAMVDGVVLAVNATTGSYVSAQGVYDTYTQGFDPLVVMGAPQDHLAVRCYVDEILVSRLPSRWHIQAQMTIRGTDTKVPLEFVRVQPYVSPKIQLSNQRQEKVDLRVLPVIFRFEKKDAPVYPGQLVDVYIGNQ